MIKIKRAYEPAEESDGTRILVDRLWPRGLGKDEATIDLWFKDLAPSTTLRKWFSHDSSKWDEFQKRYRKELNTDKAKELIGLIKQKSKDGTVSLVYAAKDEEHNNAVALKNIIEEIQN